jgi:Arc/MetJ-type ribon-helix-helix transcriptional regulator
MSTVTIRTDAETDHALAALTRGGRSRSDVVREAILAAYRLESAARLRAEAEAAAADPADLAEVRAIRAELDVDGAW